ncbi:peptide chain release factor-like protein [Candidatus Carsonella ruddii]|uniref:peptide chain release factor-like protein n=1 Tax=Carsonella ruddii TaxID=114186 RepID=UPI003D5117E6
MKDNFTLEIRQGIGGDESLFFLQDLKKMYIKFFQKNNINYKILLNLEKEVIIEMENSVFNINLINESGIHRVQRIPKNENQGKMQTSTCSVFITKNLKNTNIVLNNKDLKIETCKSSGSGGQHVNTTNSSVKITHLPTKIFVECSDERSQLLNKTKAIKILNFRINKFLSEENSLKTNLNRKNVIFKSERSKKIRTYNFQNNKIINHLTNSNCFQLNKVLNGELEILFKK